MGEWVTQVIDALLDPAQQDKDRQATGLLKRFVAEQLREALSREGLV